MPNLYRRMFSVPFWNTVIYPELKYNLRLPKGLTTTPSFFTDLFLLVLRTAFKILPLSTHAINELSLYIVQNIKHIFEFFNIHLYEYANKLKLKFIEYNLKIVLKYSFSLCIHINIYRLKNWINYSLYGYLVNSKVFYVWLFCRFFIKTRDVI